MIEWLVFLWYALLGRVTGPDADMDRIAKQPVRQRLLGLIDQEPGIHASQLCREVGESWGTVQYHLGLLRKAQMVRSVSAGRERQFYPPSVQPEHVRMLALLRQGRREEIAHFIHANPGARQVDICRGLRVSRKTFRASIVPLMEEGLLRERKGLQTNRYFPGDALGGLLGEEAEVPLSGAALTPGQEVA